MEYLAQMSKNLQRPEKARENNNINKERKDSRKKWCRSKVEDLRGFLDNLSFLLPIFTLFAHLAVSSITVDNVFFYGASGVWEWLMAMLHLMFVFI